METEKDLKVRTKRYALAVIKLVIDLPRNRVADVLSNQLLRSATSVGANYREASRARSKAEFIAKVGDSLREPETFGVFEADITVLGRTKSLVK